MTIRAFVKEWLIKVLVTLGAGGALGGGAWLSTNIVFAGDLSALAEMISSDVAKQLQPIVKQTESNTTAICTARKADLKAAIRDLRVEIEQMEKEKAAEPRTWTVRDQALLEEWSDDYESATKEFNELTC